MNADKDLRAQLAAVREELGAVRAQLDALTGSKTLAVAQKGGFGKRSIGELQVYICQGCGLVEWYVPDLAGIVADGETVRELDGSASDPGVPYR